MYKKLRLLVFGMSLSSYLVAAGEIVSKNEIMDAVDKVAVLDGDINTAYIVKAKMYEVGSKEYGIEANISKAIEFYKKAYENNSSYAAYKLGMYTWAFQASEDDNTTTKSDKTLPLFYFDSGINMSPKKIGNYNRLLSGIYAFTLSKYEVSKIYLLPLAQNLNDPYAELYLAHIYLANGDEGKANEFLTRACTNPAKKEDIIKYCSSDSVDRIDLNGISSHGKQNNPDCNL